ncbi:hypothetical protein EDB83DRAFT_2646874 [Lactarius deliciosus]|nr:hypothetical protein EDB83DRAFT_2646874 [Lactarius deliciosus]
MRKTHASQASSSEKLMLLKQELATAAELTSVLKREQLTHERAQQKAKAKNCFYDKEKVVKKPKLTEPTHIVASGSSRETTMAILYLLLSTTTPLFSKGHAAAILAQVDREMARIKDRSSLGRQNRAPTGCSCAVALQWIPPPEPTRSSSPLLSSSSSASLDDQPPTPEWCGRPRGHINDGPGPEVSPSSSVDLMEAEPTTDNPHSHHHAPPPRQPTPVYLAASLTSVSSLVFLQLFSRIFTFVRDYGIRDAADSFAQVSAQRNVSQEDDHSTALQQIPQSIWPSSDGRLLGFCLIGPASPPRFVATPSLLFRVPLSLRPPSGLHAMHHHQQQSHSKALLERHRRRGAHFYAVANEKAALGIERPTGACLVQWQPASSCDTRLDHDHPFCTSDFLVITPTPTAVHGQASPNPALPSVNESGEP